MESARVWNRPARGPPAAGRLPSGFVLHFNFGGLAVSGAVYSDQKSNSKAQNCGVASRRVVMKLGRSGNSGKSGYFCLTGDGAARDELRGGIFVVIWRLCGIMVM